MNPRNMQSGKCYTLYTTNSALPYHLYNVDQGFSPEGVQADYDSVLLPGTVWTGYFAYNEILSVEVHDDISIT